MTTAQRYQHHTGDAIGRAMQLRRREHEYEEWSEDRRPAAVEQMMQDGPQEAPRVQLCSTEVVPMSIPTPAALAECLRDHIVYHDCKHAVLDSACCTCEGKRLLGIPAGVVLTLTGVEVR